MRKRIAIMVMVTFIVTFVAGCGSTRKEQPKQAELNVFAASSLTESFAEIAQAFENSHPGVKINFNFANSQVLFSQLQNGAEADIFAPAGDKYLKEAREMGLVKQNLVYAQNSLVVAVPADNPQDIKSLQDLIKPCKVVMAVPEAPVGMYTLEVLDKCNAVWGDNYKNTVVQNVISYEPNVKQVVAKIVMNEADAGFVYYGDVVEPEKQGKLKVISIPEKLNVQVPYPVGTVSEAKNPELAGEFMNFLLSQEAQSIFKRYGMNL